MVGWKFGEFEGEGVEWPRLVKELKGYERDLGKWERGGRERIMRGKV